MALANTIFRAFNQGHVKFYQVMGGKLAGKHLLLLTTTGRKSGQRRVNPLRRFDDGDNYVVVGSVGGAPRHPGWYYNLLDNPTVEVQIGRTVERRTARVAQDEERDRLWRKIVDSDRRFAAYQKRTERVIPVVVLEP